MYPTLENATSSDDLEGLEEYWGPYFQSMIDNALEAAKTYDNVVITFAAPYKIARDFVMNGLKEGGARNVTMLYLKMDEDKKLEALYHRSKRQCEAMGSTLGETMRQGDDPWDGEGEPTLQEYMEFIRRPGQLGNVPFDGPPPYAKTHPVARGLPVKAGAKADAVDRTERRANRTFMVDGG